MSEPTYLIRVAETMREIQRDCKEDALRLDGRAFNGSNVAEVFGATLAMLSVVAKAVEMLAEAQAA